MSKRIPPEHLQLYLIVAILFLFGGWRIFHKVHSLGMPLLPQERVSVWQVETRVSFEALGGPVKVSLAVPTDQARGYKILSEDMASAGYGFSIVSDDGGRRAVWTRREVAGQQTLYYSVNVYDTFGYRGAEAPQMAPAVPLVPKWEEPYAVAVTSIIRRAERLSADRLSFTLRLLESVYTEPANEDIALLRSAEHKISREELMKELLDTSGIPSRMIRGVYLEDRQRYQPISSLLEVYTEDGWIIIDPRTRDTGLPENFLPMQRGGISLLDVEGATNSNLSIAVMKSERPVLDVVENRAVQGNSSLIDFSIHSLPLATQQMFRLLSVLPIGILVVVIMRNVIGISTSGTFMPVLISLAFAQTDLVPGLILFGLIIVSGLSIRFYLSRLNLLLVPRIAAAVIVVVSLMCGLSIISFRLGYQEGLTITFFPVIVLAWTIERASMAWEEEGANSALKQLGLSLLVAVLAYVLMINPYIEHICYNFMEVHMIILGLVLLLGAYSGARLTELWRFEPVARGK